MPPSAWGTVHCSSPQVPRPVSGRGTFLLVRKFPLVVVIAGEATRMDAEPHRALHARPWDGFARIRDSVEQACAARDATTLLCGLSRL